MFFLLLQNLQVILRDSALLPLSWNMQFCNEQTRTQRLFSPACASATYGSPQVVADSNFKYVLEIKDVPKLKDIRTLLCLISIPPRIIVMRYQLYDFDKHTHSNKSTHLPLTVEVWIIFAWHVCEDDISLIINKNNLTITSFFHDNIVVRDCYLFFTCIYLSIFFCFVFLWSI